MFDILALAEGLGFVETPQLARLRDETILAFKSGDREAGVELKKQYLDMADAHIRRQHADQLQMREADIGVMLIVAHMSAEREKLDDYREDLQEAWEASMQLGLDVVAEAILQEIAGATKP